MKSEFFVLFLVFSSLLFLGCLGGDDAGVDSTPTTLAGEDTAAASSEDIDSGFIEEEDTVEIGEML